ncbi:MAG: FAD-dependent oxidoreductase [Proteobacteria bacterium]|nr:FAD-dependent oxidoreductase [Pseudomonadota bacterium]
MDTQENKGPLPIKETTAPVGAVMVVGGGIAGIQASLDLANSGFQVYLVEETSAIGGRMAELDKTFPTNDCSMCMISPKLVEVDKHRNIEIITNAEVKTVEGQAGNFRVKVEKRPRFVDLEKCNACGDCVEKCPVFLASEFDDKLALRKAIYKRYPQAIPSAFLIDKRGSSPCKVVCPAHISVQGYVALIAQGRDREALDLIRAEVPFPAVLGRVCPHPCEAKCTRKDVEEPIAICDLKRFAADAVAAGGEDPLPVPAEKKTEKVAVVGSGPAGLTAAYYLALSGYPVTVFESLPVPGGMMAVGIPSYRLPREILNREIGRVKSLGVEIRTGITVGKSPYRLPELMSQGFQAVFLAVGAHKNRSLEIPGEDLQGVIPGVDYLRAANLGRPLPVGKKVAVIGGGNVAIDAVRTVLRQGAEEAFILYRRSRAEMPASREEIEEAEEEGIKINYLAAPVRILGEGGKVKGIECLRMELGNPDAGGRRKPVPVPGSEFRLEADTVIPAVGQVPDLAWLAGEKEFSLTSQSNLKADPVTRETGVKGVFAGGDMVSGPATVIEAIAAGKEAAVSIDRYLRGEDLRVGRPPEFREAGEIPGLTDVEPRPRVKMPARPGRERLRDFSEVKPGLSEAQAREEAGRCLACGLCSECYQCVEACQVKAIDHGMRKEEVELQVGSMILAPGFAPFDARIKGEYGYGRMPNVVTSLEFERILSASGPFSGQILRPSDKKHPKKVAWIQCVGSRDSLCGREYCSSVCCMYATKEAIIAQEHEPGLETTIFYNDLRAFGKGFERYYESARGKFGVRYQRGIISAVKEKQSTHNLVLQYSGEGGRERREEEFELVVLSVGLDPSPEAQELARRLGIGLNPHGFCRTEESSPNVTSRPGIYVAGAFSSPLDIPESVMSASSAACLAAQAIAGSRGTLVGEKVYPPERDVRGEEPRVGVFICRCGTNIARVVEISPLVLAAARLPGVVHVEENLYTCSTDTQRRITEVIREKGINRVVVASCSPRTHEPLFQDTLREAGLNKYLFEMANIRDQCSWVHFSHPREATAKAGDLIRMAVARAATLEALEEFPMPIKHRALVIGGGLAGISASLSLSAQGFETVLVEKTDKLGGHLAGIQSTLEGFNPGPWLEELITRLERDPRITIYKNAEITDFSGYVGNFLTTIAVGKEKKEIEHGVAIVATGAEEYKPTEYLYGQSARVVTQKELEGILARGGASLREARSVVMIQCVGSREEKHMYCSRICCSQAVKNALKLKEMNPGLQVSILFRDIRTYAFRELYYKKAREKGVLFFRFDPEEKPRVSRDDQGRLQVEVLDLSLNRWVRLSPDYLVLSAAVRPRADAHELATRLKLPLNADGFFMEAHLKLRPLDFANEGIFLAGLAHSPKFIGESLVQAQGAVSRAATILSQPFLNVGGVVAVVDAERCAACLTCVRECPFQVPRIGEKGVAEIAAAACQGCGICAAACPRKAIFLQNYKDEQVVSKLKALYEDNDQVPSSNNQTI